MSEQDQAEAQTEAAVESSGQPTPDDAAPGYGEPEKTEAVEDDVALRVHTADGGDPGDYKYQGDDSAAQVNDQSADESGRDGWQK
jgi:hypothetical protein